MSKPLWTMQSMLRRGEYIGHPVKDRCRRERAGMGAARQAAHSEAVALGGARRQAMTHRQLRRQSMQQWMLQWMLQWKWPRRSLWQSLPLLLWLWRWQCW